MPLTPFQQEVAVLLSQNRSEDSHLAGGAAIHLSPESTRYSNDLDYFHDSADRVAEAFGKDRDDLAESGYQVSVDLNQPGYIRAIVSKDSHETQVEWAHDSAWRFMPPVKDDLVGYRLHPVDLATNKVLTLLGRGEARDYLDLMEAVRSLLPLGALCWAAAGKDPGFTPRTIVDLLKRRGKFQPEDFERLHLSKQPDMLALKRQWLEALHEAESFVASRPTDEAGCLYFDTDIGEFVGGSACDRPTVSPHFGRPGGVLPSLA